MYKNKWIVKYDSDIIVRLVVAFAAVGTQAFHLSPALAIEHWAKSKVSIQ